MALGLKKRHKYPEAPSFQPLAAQGAMGEAVEVAGGQLPPLTRPGAGHAPPFLRVERKGDRLISRSENRELQLMTELGRGSYGQVYLARDRATQALSAVKMADGRHQGSETRREAQVAVAARSPLAPSQILHDGTRAYAVMPLMGESLGAMIQYWWELRAEHRHALTLRFGAQVLSQLHDMHSANMVHGDIKPDNLMRRDGDLLLSDFGSGRNASYLAANQSHRGAWTPEYVSPELLRKKRLNATTACAADLWAAGLTLCFLVNRRFGDAFGTVKRLHSDRNLLHRLTGTSKLEEALAGAHPKLQKVLKGLLTADPASRMSAREACDRLHALRDPRLEAEALAQLARRDRDLGARLARAAHLGCAVGLLGGLHSHRPSPHLLAQLAAMLPAFVGEATAHVMRLFAKLFGY